MHAGLVITQFQERWVKFPPGLVQGYCMLTLGSSRLKRLKEVMHRCIHVSVTENVYPKAYESVQAVLESVHKLQAAALQILGILALHRYLSCMSRLKH
ncbi:hypothetical protein L195_g053373, partial [Trifolium pratense]